MLVDLHLHSTASDGTRAPGEVLRLAAKRGMRLVALTDHDTVGGLAEAAAAARETGVALIPGVEISCEGETEAHLLGYGLDAASPAWVDFFAGLRRERRERASRIVALLAGMGYPLDERAVLGDPSRNVSRVHIAQALVAAGAASSVKEAFQRLLSPGRPAYLARPLLPLPDAAGRLRAQGAVPVLAHPGLLPLAEELLERRIRAWHEQGLAGIEAHHPSHTPSQARRFERLARSLGMLVTGGSDAHGEPVRATRIGEGMDAWRTRAEDAEALWRLAPNGVGDPFCESRGG